jgi:hypothetical protein
LETIDYGELERFCQEQPEEDVDLDYKVAFPNDLDRVICAFANTQGGMVLIGIAEEAKTRRPEWPPVGLDGDADQARQRVLNIAFEAVYPPIEPEVRACPIPDSSRYVLLVRVHQSNLLHAVDRRSRIYVRSKDNNRGYALADLHQLQWLWDKRQASIRLRESLLDASHAHSSSPAIPFRDGVSPEEWTAAAHLTLSIVPAFPQLPIVSGARGLLDLLNTVPPVRSNWSGVDRKVPWQENVWRTTTSSVCLSNRGHEYAAQFVELGDYGQLLFDFLIHRQPVDRLPVPIHTAEECIYSYIVLSSLDIAIKYAASVYEVLSFRSPIILAASLAGMAGLRLWFSWPGSTNTLAMERLSPACPDNVIPVLSLEAFPDSFSGSSRDFVTPAARRLVWSFGLGWSEDEIDHWLDRHYGSKDA